jgi:hypothetical protein
MEERAGGEEEVRGFKIAKKKRARRLREIASSHPDQNYIKVTHET